MLIHNGDTVLFQGDSVTDCGRRNELFDSRHFGGGENLGAGYPLLFSAAFAAKYPDKNITFINRANSGERVKDLKARWEADCLKHSPDVLFVLIGVNDVWRKFDQNDETKTADFAACYGDILRMTRQKNKAVKIVLLEPFYLNTENNAYTEAFYAELAEKRAAVKALADRAGAYFLSLHEAFQEAGAHGEYTKWVYSDGVHPTNAGHGLIAARLLTLCESAE